MVAKNPRNTRRYRDCVDALRARGDAYCWRGCGRFLRADIRDPKHPQFMTLGHIVALEDDPSLFYQPSNHMPECAKCNYGDGARRTNAKRAGRGRQAAQLRTSPDLL